MCIENLHNGVDIDSSPLFITVDVIPNKLRRTDLEQYALNLF